MNAQDYITKRLADLREQLGKPCDPIGRTVIEAKISDLEAVQSHFSQSTRPEVAGTGKYQALKGKSVSYLAHRDGFYIAQAFDNLEGHEVLERIASDLNELEALRESHAELIPAFQRMLLRLSKSPINAAKGLIPLGECDFQEWQETLARAQSLQSTNKTPVAAS